MKVIVLGAGVVGVTSAWFLHKAGHDVTVIERQPGAGLETSFANGGQISVSHAEPWARPGALLNIIRSLGREDAPLLFRLRPDLHQWLWGLRFLRECSHARLRHNIAQLVNLGLYSRATLQALRADTGIEYDQQQRGILHFYTSQREFDQAQAPARLMREFGCELDMKSARQCVEIEPALAPLEARLAGGSMTAADESGDAHQFTRKLAALAAAHGVCFDYGATVTGLGRGAAGIDGVHVRRADGATGTLTADACVVALGSYSAALLRPLGVHLSIYPAKGYSVTVPVTHAAAAYQVSLTDDEHKLVFSRLGTRLRIAGTAEFNGYDTAINARRCAMILERARALFPDAADYGRAELWAGLRPATPSNVPYIGRTAYANLYLNTGHGTLGWTHACGSARALTDVIGGRVPELDFAFTGMGRSRRRR